MSTSTTPRTPVHNLQVATVLHTFINEQVLPGTGVSADKFWKGFDALVSDLAPKNMVLLAERDRLQTELDAWHCANPGPIQDMPAYRAFLEKIGYLVPEPKKVRIEDIQKLVATHYNVSRSDILSSRRSAGAALS